MNVSSSSTSISTSSTNQSSTATKQAENPTVSFDEEMKSAQQPEQSVQQEEKTTQKEVDAKQNNQKNNDVQNKILQGKIEQDTELINAKFDSSNLLSINIQQLLETQNQLANKSDLFKVNIYTNEDLSTKIGQSLEISILEMTENDAQFFVDVVKNNNVGVQNIVQDIQQTMEFGTEEVQKSANVSKTLLNALQNSMKTGQAVRIDFGNDVAVVMRVGRDGSIMANFIPGDKAVEEYLKNNIEILKQRFDDEEIKYSQLSYSQHQQQKERNKNNKENKHE